MASASLGEAAKVLNTSATGVDWTERLREFYQATKWIDAGGASQRTRYLPRNAVQLRRRIPVHDTPGLAYISLSRRGGGKSNNRQRAPQAAQGSRQK